MKKMMILTWMKVAYGVPLQERALYFLWRIMKIILSCSQGHRKHSPLNTHLDFRREYGIPLVVILHMFIASDNLLSIKDTLIKLRMTVLIEL